MPPRPYMDRFTSLSLVILPSTGPVLHGSASAAPTAARSRRPRPLVAAGVGVVAGALLAIAGTQVVTAVRDRASGSSLEGAGSATEPMDVDG